MQLVIIIMKTLVTNRQLPENYYFTGEPSGIVGKNFTACIMAEVSKVKLGIIVMRLKMGRNHSQRKCIA